MKIKFGEWLPDQAPYEKPGTHRIENAVPTIDGYGPLSSCVDTGDGGILGTPNILFHLVDTSGISQVFAGDGTKLYLYAEGTGFTDVSKAGGYTDGGFAWNVALFGNVIYMVNGIDPIQRWDLSGSVQFEDVPGLPNLLTGRYITVVRDFLVIGYTSENGIENNNQIRWSARNNGDDWIPDPATQSSFKDIPEQGASLGLTGGDYGTCLFEEGLIRMDYLGGPPDFMQFDDVEGGVGCLEPRTVIRVFGKTYYLSKQGWRVFDGASSSPIGAERVDRTFFRLVDETKYNRVSKVNLPSVRCIGWLFVTTGTPDGGPNAMLLHNYDINRWGFVTDSQDNPFLLDCLGHMASPGTTVEQLGALYATVEDIPGSIDSRVWKGETLEIASAIDRNGNLCTFTGSPMTGIFTTAEFGDGSSTRITRADPLIDGDCTPTLDIGSRRSLNTAEPVWQQGIGLNSAGFFPANNRSQFHRFRLKLVGGWLNAMGLNVRGVRAGET